SEQGRFKCKSCEERDLGGPCSTTGCRNKKVKGETKCVKCSKKTQSTVSIYCKVTACTTKRKWESEYCRDHGCETPGCEEGRETSSNLCKDCTEETETVRKERRKCERTG